MPVLAGVSIPNVQTAAVVPKIGGDIEIRKQYPVKSPKELKPGECLVKLSHTGVCHTDLHAKKGDWPIPPINPLVGGHEGVGEVVAIGENTANSPVKLGDRVGIKWLANSCLDCEFCRQGAEPNCVNAQLSGYTVDGTFAQYAVSFVHHVTPIPANLDSAGAASILCAGVTVYKALKNSEARVGNYVVIPGAGGGLGHLAVQYAHAMGLRVIAIDTGADKERLVKKLGAESWIDFKTTKDLVGDVIAASGGVGAHASIVVAAHPSAYEQAVDYLRPTGVLVVVGLPNAPLGANVFWTVFKSIKIVGSYVGNRQDAIEALDIASAGKVKVEYALKDLSDLKEVYEGLEKGIVAGRVVLSVH
ncbi:ADH1_1 [Sanghuangporus sanghuang]